MRRKKLFQLLGLVLSASVILGAFAAVDAGAYSKAQKAKIRRQLARQMKHNPRVVLKRSFIKKASQVDFQLPLTLRFRPNSNLTLDLGSLGVKNVGLQGELGAHATFVDPSQSGVLGELRVAIDSTGPVEINNAGGATGTATAVASPISVLVNTDPTNGPASACSAYSGPTGTGGGADPLDVTGGGVDSVGVTADNVFRTGYLPIGVASTVPNGPAPGNAPFVGKSGGEAYLFGPPAGRPGVDVEIAADTEINSILRTTATTNPLLSALNYGCAQAWSGAEENILNAHLQGNLQIAPDITADGRLRLAVATLGNSVPEPNVVTACTVPYQLYSAPGQPAGEDVPITNGSETGDVLLTQGIANGFPFSAPVSGGSGPGGATQAGDHGNPVPCNADPKPLGQGVQTVNSVPVASGNLVHSSSSPTVQLNGVLAGSNASPVVADILIGPVSDDTNPLQTAQLAEGEKVLSPTAPSTLRSFAAGNL